MDINSKALYSLLVAMVIVGGIGIGYVLQHENMADSDIAAAGTSDGVYHLTLVITTNNYWNNTTDQPAYFVFQNGSLTSSANIILPANTLIETTIINYDDGNASIPTIYENVTGTVGNEVTIINNTLINSTQTSNGISIKGAWTTDHVPMSDVAHTFTVAGLNLNVPVVVSAVEQFTFETGNVGSFGWQCYATCGAGESGWEASMSAPGWMSGTITVQ